MQIRNVAHDGLREFISDDDAAGLAPAAATRVRRIVSFLQDMDGGDEVRTVPGWSTLSRAEGALERLSIPVAEGCRLVFRVDKRQAEILDLDWLDGRYGGGDDGDGRHKA